MTRPLFLLNDISRLSIYDPIYSQRRNPRPVGVVIGDWLCLSRMGLAKGPLTAIPYLELLPQHREGGKTVSRFRKLSHTIWHCQYHVVWVPKYCYQILNGPVRDAMHEGIHSICSYTGCEITEMNVQRDHVHLVVMVPPKLSVSDLMGRLKGQTAIRLLKQFQNLRKMPYWGNHLWSKGYCVDTVGLDAEMIRKHVKYQTEKDRQMEQLRIGFK